MGLLTAIARPLGHVTENASTTVLLLASVVTFTILAVVLNVLKQLLFRKSDEPPIVFHWIPILGSTVTYGIDPYKFFFSSREKVGTRAHAWEALDGH